MEDKKGKNVDAENNIKTEDSHAKNNPLALILAIIALLLGSGGLVFGWMAYEKTAKPITFLNSGTDGNSANFTEGSIADIANKVSESVVSIITSTKTTNLFGQSYDSAAAGTGVIVTSDGYILTNKHVINGANEVTVVLDDGTTYEKVEVVATDPLNDIAFLKIDGVSDLSAATLGDSKTITVGQQVIAIGNALGEYQNTVTAGIISGTGRSVTASDGNGYNVETLTDMIQTDAAINSGNSGGPLVNATGEVIGINTATSASAENMGFAIPISSVKGMLSQLIETGKASRAYLGVYSAEITPELAKAYNLPVSVGTYLYSSSSYSAIVKDSPASKAGLKDKDIVTAVNGVKVGAAGSLSNLIGEYKPGDTVQLTVIREGNEVAVNVTLEGYKN
ncbi:trypsin-like peptidase domain-containing protein [Candidatus Saccharibacteria bacterium]|nr:trypsin-like peptidase domain-containing protein [Candidatus Saccharibacteria bacterium]